MKKFLLTILLILVMCSGLVGCQQIPLNKDTTTTTGNEGEKQTLSTDLLVSNYSVPFRNNVTKVSDIPSEQLVCQLKQSYQKGDYYFLQYYLGYIENVPLQEVEAFEWTGALPEMEREFTSTSTTSETIGKASEITI